MDSCHEIVYKCSNPKCSNTQTIRFWPDERPIMVTCCVKCRAGFGIDLDKQLAQRIGMFPQVA